MALGSNTFFRARHFTHSHKNDYLNDRLNAQRVLAVISLLIPFTLFSLYLIAPHTSDTGSGFLLITISIVVILTAIIRLIANWKTPREDVYQLICAFLDFLGIAAILIGYAFTYDVPISVALKSPTANIFFVFLASRVVLIHGPLLIKTCGAALITWVGLTGLAIFEPKFTGRTSSYVEYLTSFKVLLGAEVERGLQFIIITAILYMFIHLIRHDPATGYLRRPIFLQSIAKFLSASKGRPRGKTHALIEFRITSLSSADKTYNAIFTLVSELPLLKTVRVNKIGRLSNRNVAVWIRYPHDELDLNEFAAKLSIELSQAAVLRLGSQAPLVVIGATELNYEASNEEHLTYTDIAIRDARINGKPARVFDEDIRAAIAREEAVKQAIDYGLSHDLVSVEYQPIIDLMTDRPIGFEALVRLTDKNGKNIPPDVFIPVAESEGLIGDITDALCSIVAAEGVLISNLFLREGVKPYININISPQQLSNIERTISALNRAQRSRAIINVEITESGVLNEVNTLAQIEKLRQAGFSLAIDDFGTGHSSISRLSQLEVSTLKIDRCFIENIEDGKGYAFLEAIVNLSRTTSELVIMEGIETLPQKLLLMKMGIRFCQGYFFARPMGLGELEEYLLQEHGMKGISRNRIGHIAGF